MYTPIYMYIHVYIYIYVAIYLLTHTCDKGSCPNICDVTYLWRNHIFDMGRSLACSLVCVTWIISLLICDSFITNLFICPWLCPGSCPNMCDMIHSKLIPTCDMTHPWIVHICCTTPLVIPRHAWHDSFMRVTWRIHVCDMTHSCVWSDTSIFVSSRIHLCDMTLSCIFRDAFTCVTCIVYMCDMWLSGSLSIGITTKHVRQPPPSPLAPEAILHVGPPRENEKMKGMRKKRMRKGEGLREAGKILVKWGKREWDKLWENFAIIGFSHSPIPSRLLIFSFTHST